MQRILLISHEVSRTGAPMVVLHFARWLRRSKPGIGVSVLALKDGGLAADFKEVADDYHLLTRPVLAKRNLVQRVGARILRMVGLMDDAAGTRAKARLMRQLVRAEHDVILANSLRSIPVGVELKRLSGGKTLLVAYIHELEHVLRSDLPDLVDHLPDIDRVLAASELVRDNLVRNWGVPSNKVALQYECATVTALPTTPTRDHPVFTVGACGTVTLRKGYDLFIQVACWIRRNHPDLRIQFTWVGRVQAYERSFIDVELAKMGLTDMVHFIGERADPSTVFNEFDLFLLTSREDPFPLVCIEVGILGKPIICFDKATGTTEVVRSGGGRIVPYLDVEAMGAAVVEFAKDPGLAVIEGDKARALFAQFTPEIQCPLLFEHVQRAEQQRSLVG
jgi:glycosyltransferase involved in cell wall biosynthesis